ncbi:hypothetical protein LTR53_000038 [Teratosphaeriaceae sp. CCFEE 6253]|nr:hypothetical protein LTR53_000038 [Teratosphaeriaceae sp. CCFEE 6253]
MTLDVRLGILTASGITSTSRPSARGTSTYIKYKSLLMMKLLAGEPRPGYENFVKTPDIEQVEAALQRLSVQPSSSDNGTCTLFTLAAGSKAYPRIRPRLATPDILKTLIDAVKCGLSDSHETTIAALRCIGNACIDNDAARTSLATLGFGWALLCLRHDSDEIKALTTKVLYNICTDHEPAQRQCYDDRVHVPLISVCASPLTLRSEDKTIAIDLLFWITGHKADLPAGDLIPLSDNTVLELLSLPSYHYASTNLEDFATLIEIGLTSLRDPAVQTQVIRSRRVAHVWQMFVDCEARSLGQGPDARAEEEEEVDALEILRPLSTSLLWILSDLAADEAFGVHYRLPDRLPDSHADHNADSADHADRNAANATNDIADHAFLDALLLLVECGGARNTVTPRTVFEQRSELGARLSREADRTARDLDYTVTATATDTATVPPRLLAAACQILGNLLRVLPDEDVARLVLSRRLHVPLWRAARQWTRDAEVAHAVAGLLVQMTRPEGRGVRERMVEDVRMAGDGGEGVVGGERVGEVGGRGFEGGEGAVEGNGRGFESGEGVAGEEVVEETLTLLCAHAVPQVRDDGLRLLRALGRASELNQRRFKDLAAHVMAAEGQGQPADSAGPTTPMRIKPA